MIFRISFSDVFHFTLNARKGPLIPEGFVLETPPERRPTSLRRHSVPPSFPSTLPTIVQSPTSPLVFAVPETLSGPVMVIGNDSTETLVNIVPQPVYPKPILILNASAHERRQTRRISFADSVTSRSVTPTNGISVGQVLCEPPAAVGETQRQSEDIKESVPEVGKESRRKSIRRVMSMLAPRAYRGKPHPE
jgi:hypothetical protein